MICFLFSNYWWHFLLSLPSFLLPLFFSIDFAMGRTTERERERENSMEVFHVDFEKSPKPALMLFNKYVWLTFYSFSFFFFIFFALSLSMREKGKGGKEKVLQSQQSEKGFGDVGIIFSLCFSFFFLTFSFFFFLTFSILLSPSNFFPLSQLFT